MCVKYLSKIIQSFLCDESAVLFHAVWTQNSLIHVAMFWVELQSVDGTEKVMKTAKFREELNIFISMLQNVQ